MSAQPTWEQFDALYARIERAEAVLAVAREREQHAVRALRSLRGWAYVESLAHGIEMPPNLAALLDAALADEPAAALAGGGDEGGTATAREPASGVAPAASAAADEPAHGFAGVAGQGSHSQRSSQAAPATSARGHSSANDAAALGASTPSREDAAGLTAADSGAAPDEPGETPDGRSCAKPTRGIYGVQSRCARPLGHYGDCDSIWKWRDWSRGGVSPSGKERP